MRNGNQIFEVPLGNLQGVIVHRGVSQGGRELSPAKRLAFWYKNTKKVKGVNVGWGARFTLGALDDMRRRNLVLVVNPAKPQVWTPTRILKTGKRFSAVKFTAIKKFQKNVQRKGGLQL